MVFPVSVSTFLLGAYMHYKHQEQFDKYLLHNDGSMEIIDDPIVVNMKAKKMNIQESSLFPPYQAFLIEYIEIKGLQKKESLFNSKACILRLDIGGKRYNYTLQLFHYNRKKEAYIYELGIPLMIQSQQFYRISIDGIHGNIIIILHGKRARPLQ